MFITHGDARLFALSFGSGSRTIVGMGGWAGSWELWADPYATLSRSWRAVAYDHRGVGATVCPTESITLDVLTDDLFAVMDAFEIDRCVLAAESAGGAIALLAALQHPERFRGLVLVDSLYYREPAAGTDRFRMGLQYDYPGTIAAFVQLCLPDADRDAERRWGHQILARCAQADALRLYELMDGVDLRPRIPEIQLPALVIHGTADQIVPVSDAHWLAGALPNAHLHLIEGAGHVPTLTHGDEIARAINAFFPTA